MRYLASSAFMLVALSACPSDDEGGDTGADTGTDPTTSPSTTNGMSTSTTGDTDTSGTTMEPEEGSSSSGEAGPPVINGVTWTQAEGCMEGTGSDVEIVIDVTDPDNDVSELTISGMAIGCSGEIDAATVTLLCPQVAPYPTTIEVEDPDGNTADIEFDIEICMDGSATP